MNYYVVGINGLLECTGNYHVQQELDFLRKLHGDSLKEGVPKGYDLHSAPSDEHRWHVNNEEWVIPPKPEDVLSGEARYKRDCLMTKTDWRVARAHEAGQEVPRAWQEYRQALRDITEQPGFPYDVDWPQEPTD